MSHVNNIREMLKSWIQWWNRNANFNPILQSRLVLYVLFFFSVLTLFGFALNREYVFAIIFIIVGFLTSFFSKNMIVILFLSLAVTNIIIQGLRGQLGAQKEGMADQGEEEEGKSFAQLGAAPGAAPVAKLGAAPGAAPVAKLGAEQDQPQEKVEPMETFLESDKGGKSSEKINKRMSSEAQAKKEIKNLLDLQLKLMTGVNSIQPIMKEVEGAINDLRNKTFQ